MDERQSKREKMQNGQDINRSSMTARRLIDVVRQTIDGGTVDALVRTVSVVEQKGD